MSKNQKTFQKNKTLKMHMKTVHEKNKTIKKSKIILSKRGRPSKKQTVFLSKEFVETDFSSSDEEMGNKDVFNPDHWELGQQKQNKISPQRLVLRICRIGTNNFTCKFV